MKYILLEKSAIEELINNVQMQSIEFDLSKEFISNLRNGIDDNIINRIGIIRTKDGMVIAGERLSRTFLLIDLEQCALFEKCNDQEVLTILQKTFRFAVRFWNRQSFTNCEKIFKDKTVIFPFPFSKGSANRIVIARDVVDKRLDGRGINNSLLAYKYSDKGIAASAEERPETSNYRKGGEAYLKNIAGLRLLLEQDDNTYKSNNINRVERVVAEHMIADSSFKYMDYERQMQLLTSSQKKVVDYESMSTPVKIEGPAGTGKTASMVLRAIRILNEYSSKKENIKVYFFTHSKSTEAAVKQMINVMADPKWTEEGNAPYLKITTLQDFCVNYIKLNDTQIIDLDAAEVKQYQLLLIQDAYSNVKGDIFNTYRCFMSEKAIRFFEEEEENKIILLLQYEFSIRIKGMAEGDLDKYKKLQSIKNGIPFENEMDKEYVYRIYREYQQFLESQSVYDTDDIILEALARFNAPLWRRERSRNGIDYLFVDEMHLFNLNERQVFHYLTKDVSQSEIPICFALDYGQVIGERVDLNLGEEFINSNAYCQEFSTVFRSSQQIAELCASITASGALLFDAFINPYKYCESRFTAKEESMCSIPKLIMYENDTEMVNSLEKHIKDLVNRFKCKLSEIALIFFDEKILENECKDKIGKYSVNCIDGRREGDGTDAPNKVVCSYPEYINGLEFKCVILVGVDEGRVPQSGIFDISTNFLKYNALNKLYLSCSRAQYSVTMLGTNIRGISSCIEHSIRCEAIKVEKRRL